MAWANAKLSVRVGAAVFVASCIANAFFWWSFPAWFGLFGPPKGLVNPMVDKWLIAPVAMAVLFFLQLPANVLFNLVHVHIGKESDTSNLIMTSLVSTCLYAPFLMGVFAWRKARGGITTRCS